MGLSLRKTLNLSYPDDNLYYKTFNTYLLLDLALHIETHPLLVGDIDIILEYNSTLFLKIITIDEINITLWTIVRYYSNIELVKVLLKWGADVNYILSQNTILDRSFSLNNSKISQLLRENGAKTYKELSHQKSD